jgi:curved DNA-binding protein CbpA
VNNPFETLGLSASATDAEIRARYLALVREHPPEKSPDKFAQIRDAYAEVTDAKQRFKRALFVPPNDSFDAILADFQQARQHQRIPTRDLLALGRN